MMNNRVIINYINAEPFAPFRIKMVSGETFSVRHPEMISVGRTTLRVFEWLSEDGQEAKQRERELSIILIESIEILDAPVPHDQNRN